jgi:D-alanyl-D-alanine carboxypeptidase
MLGGLKAVRGLRVAVCALGAAVVFTAVTSDPADARRRGRYYAAYSPAYAAIVIDANSGKELHATNADATRHPASLTKIMTLYMLFEQLEAGKLKIDSEMRVSQHASDQSPTRLGLDEGEMLKVEDAIKGLVTRSANDAAVVIAETIAGSEENFARLMTRKARALGMSRTTYRNASGLPDDEQVTTARDQALLGRAIQDRFPQYYRYFSTRSFVFQGQYMGNHNRLLGRIDGIDGIKTGYTRASGFNLVSSIKRGNRYLVAAVLGGPSAGWRDQRMASLLEQNIREGATVRTAAKIVEQGETRIATVEPKLQPQAQILTRADAAVPVPAQPVASATVTGTTEPIQPVKVKTIAVKAGALTIPELVGLVAPAPQAKQAPAQFAATVNRREDSPAPEAPAATYDVASAQSTPVALPPAPPATPVAAAPAQPPSPAVARGAWIIQVGAFPEEEKAKERIREAQTLGKTILAKANPFTEKVVKGNQELYRARFAGFDENAAQKACSYFKRNDIACMAMRY